MKILVAGHGGLPEALIESARMIGGELADLRSLCFHPGDTPQDLRVRMSELLKDFPASVILTDLAGGTPDNVANVVVKAGQAESVQLIVAGVSLPLLLEFALSGDSTDDINPEELIGDTSAMVRYRNEDR